MKLACCALCLLMLSGPVFAHPGRLDENGGHYCRSKCEQYGLEYGEYHYHRQPPPDAETPPGPETSPPTVTAEPSGQTNGATLQTETERTASLPHAEKMLWVMLLWKPIAIISLALVALWEFGKLACSLKKKFFRGKNGNDL